MAMTEEQKVEALKYLQQDLGFSDEEIKGLGLSEDELAAVSGFGAEKVVKIELELDDSHRLSDDELEEMLDLVRQTVKGRRTAKEFFMLAGSAANMYIKMKSLGTIGA